MCGVGRGRGRRLEVLAGECEVCLACLEDQFCSLYGVVFKEDQETSGETVQTRQDGPEGEWQWSALEQKVEFTPSTLPYIWPDLGPSAYWCFSKQSV